MTIDEHLSRKLKAIDTFGTQAGVRDYLEPGLISSTARYWSRYCGGNHAEPYTVPRQSLPSPKLPQGAPLLLVRAHSKRRWGRCGVLVTRRVTWIYVTRRH